jgi:hypothetical protein
VVEGEGKVFAIVAIFHAICLFAGYVHYELLLSIMPDVS